MRYKSLKKAQKKFRNNFGDNNSNGFSGSLKEQPITETIEKVPNYGHCIPTDPQKIEAELAALEKNPETFFKTGYGKKSRKSYKSHKSSSKSYKKILKKLTKKCLKKSLKILKKKLKKKQRKSRRSSRRFGSGIFYDMRLGVPDDYNLDVDTKLGLPSYETSPASIYNNENIYYQGAALPRPYDRIDLGRLNALENIVGFGSRKNKSRKNNKNKLCRFGQTPGSSSWIIPTPSPLRIELDNYVAPNLAGAKGLVGPTFNYYDAGPNKNIMTQPGNYFNVPMQYTNNQMNSPIPPSGRGFGKKRMFGSSRMPSTAQVFGPNVVGHEQGIPAYHAGSTTINFGTGELYSPIGIVPGPTNSSGTYANIATSPYESLSVMPDGITHNSYLSVPMRFGKSLGKVSKKPGKRFGTMIQNVDVSGSGQIVDYQKEPDYVSIKDTIPKGSYANYGKVKKSKLVDETLLKNSKKDSKDSSKDSKDSSKDSRKDLKTSKKKKKSLFGSEGKTITLTSTGSIIVN